MSVSLSAPGLAKWLHQNTARVRQGARLARWRFMTPGPNNLSHTLIKRAGTTVLSGPFAGMRYSKLALYGAVTTKLLGSYEAELHPLLQRVLKTKYTRVIDIGGAEGYYSTGLALKIPSAKVYTFDINPVARMQCREMARINGVSARVKTFSRCSAQLLDSIKVGKVLIFCDCDGCELDLLDPRAAPNLLKDDILVETHDCFNPVISATLLARFSASHVIERIEPVARDPADYPAIAYLDQKDQATALDEFRPEGQAWLFMRAKANT